MPALASTITGPIVNPANGHFYYLLSQATWSASEAEAITLGGHLVTIDDAAENAWVVSTFGYFASVSRQLWIGLNDLAAEGSFVWSSGAPFSYANWHPGEPNGGTGENVVHIAAPGLVWAGARWFDRGDVLGFGETFNGVVEIVPEPGTAVFLVTGSFGLGVYGRARSNGRRGRPAAQR